MAAVSATVWVEHESQMDTVTAVSGSGPAYFFLFMEALEAAAHERGLPRDVAHKLDAGNGVRSRANGAPIRRLLGNLARAGHIEGRYHRGRSRGP